MNLSQIKRKILPVLRKHKVSKAGLFGSAARGEMKKKSDIDILLEPPEEASLLDIIGIKLDLEKSLGKTVDLVEYSAIKPSLRSRILHEEVSVL